MKIPKHIQDSIIKSAKYRAMANEHNMKVREWLENNGLYNKLGVEDCIVDSLEMMFNPNSLIEYIEDEQWNTRP
jgi:hypothetical protein